LALIDEEDRHLRSKDDLLDLVLSFRPVEARFRIQAMCFVGENDVEGIAFGLVEGARTPEEAAES
jgi:hypothetical protein